MKLYPLTTPKLLFLLGPSRKGLNRWIKMDMSYWLQPNNVRLYIQGSCKWQDHATLWPETQLFLQKEKKMFGSNHQTIKYTFFGKNEKKKKKNLAFILKSGNSMWTIYQSTALLLATLGLDRIMGCKGKTLEQIVNTAYISLLRWGWW